MNNPLMKRKQMCIEMIHPELPNVPKTEVRKKLAEKNKTKEECVVVYGLKTKFGGGKSTGFALIYTDLDSRKKYDSRKQLLRDKLVDKRAKSSKQKKEIKGRVKKVRGKAKAKAANAGGKKPK
eukprot:TRINITY_DN3311_c0_g1_i1.p1 TRINITY_DN3311_c0_g1~~TRINITY_DN3311_c0_g1_i1.p1  ORF type:complete len:137 (-),score=36.73 TRINITY_DN3311_c0_g1_i1:24-392(-)